MPVRVRIAPSPTGYLHVGTARTALFNFLFARSVGGAYVLRLEDTDRERNKPEFEREIYESLEWLGLAPDEGPLTGGPYGPYRDSERVVEHRAALETLLREGKAFYCSHPSDKEEYSAHWCEFRDGGAERGIIRFKSPKATMVTFTDLVHGEVSISTDTFGDFSIGRSIDSPLYNFAVTVDDAVMEISHVIRGDDHIANTPKQLLLYEALGYRPPAYAHLPLLLGTDRSKLSKRHGATSITQFREQGYLPEALVNFLTLLGWNPGTEQEIFSLDELAPAFSFEKVNESGAIFDITKLDWMNGEYIRKLPLEELEERLRPFFIKAGVDTSVVSKEQLHTMIQLEQPRLTRLAEIGERTAFYFTSPEPSLELLRWKTMTNAELRASLETARDIISGLDSLPTKEDFERALMPRATEMGDRGRLLWPLRVALSGRKASPGPFEIGSVLGRIETLTRLEKALTIVGAGASFA